MKYASAERRRGFMEVGFPTAELYRGGCAEKCWWMCGRCGGVSGGGAAGACGGCGSDMAVRFLFRGGGDGRGGGEGAARWR